jgi:hypothetical protein
MRILLGLAFAGAMATPAAAWPYLDVVSTETISVDPPLYRTTFTITEVGFRPIYGEILITPLDPATTRLFECATEAPWSCDATFNAGQSFVVLYLNGPETPGTFRIVTNQAAPCVKFRFIDVLIGGHQDPVYAPDIDACLDVDLPVPARASSWGSLKSVYR